MSMARETGMNCGQHIGFALWVVFQTPTTDVLVMRGESRHL